jgi:uncharacterized Zn-binding protein involved in type VI secretion
MVKVNGQMVAVNSQSQTEAVKVNGQMAAFKGLHGVNALRLKWHVQEEKKHV